MQKLTGSVEKETNKIQSRFKALNDNVQGQTANLAAQFQDIGVQLASGTSPLTVALQQGTQIAAVLGESKGGAAGAVKSLGAAFASVVSPISLATIGIIALGGAAIQYIAGAVGDVESLDDKLKTHADLIKQIKDAYGEAAEGLEDYAKQSTAVLEAQTRASIVKLQEDLEKLAKTIARAASATPSGVMTNIGTIEVDTAEVDQAAAKYDAFAGAVKRLRDEAQNGTPNIRAFQAAVADVANQNPGDEKIQKLAAELLSLSKEAYDVETALDTARRAIGLIGDVAAGQVGSVKELKSALSDLARIGLPTTGEFRAEEAYKRAIENARTPGERAQVDSAYLEAQQRLRDREAEAAAEKARREAERKAEQGARRAASDAERAREAYAQEIADLQNATRARELEFDMLGKSNVEREKARTLMEVENALRRDGVTLTDAQRADIEQLAEAYAQTSEKLRDAQAAQAEWQQLASSSLKGFVSDLMNGVSAADALQNALARVGDRLIDIAINSIFDPKSGGGLGSLFSSLFQPLGPKMATGGYVSGKGTGTSDSITARLSNGEYVVNAKATKQHRDLLDAMNFGKFPGFAKGGFVGIPAIPAAVPRGGASGGYNVQIIEAPGTKASVQKTNGPKGPGLRVQLMNEMAGMVANGDFDKVFKGRFGVSPMGGR
ncbi:phage tail length tape measure family protein [Microvirga sp. BSC39]|uniref:phage tail length tape measure family protein n=1 Tax=Microvirga sp. BSC39 TaxID=1549810 RepID=UPI0013640C2F|nr:phage tail length tape measure family protein [Microvirga sp. BSC39]